MDEYYLHTNGSLIYKMLGVNDPDSSFIVKIWNANEVTRSPTAFINFLKEALDLGASKKECLRLYEHSHVDSFIPIAVAKSMKELLNG